MPIAIHWLQSINYQEFLNVLANFIGVFQSNIYRLVNRTLFKADFLTKVFNKAEKAHRRQVPRASGSLGQGL